MDLNKRFLLYLQYVALLNLKAKEYKVLLYVLPNLDFYEYNKISQKNISDDLGISKSDVSKAINNLIKFNLLILKPNSFYKNKKKELKLNNYSDEKLGDMIIELIEKNNKILDIDYLF